MRPAGHAEQPDLADLDIPLRARVKDQQPQLAVAADPIADAPVIQAAAEMPAVVQKTKTTS